LLARVAITLLEQTEQLLAPAVDLVHVIVRELAPLLLHLALHLLPLPLQHVLVHDLPSRKVERMNCSSIPEVASAVPVPVRPRRRGATAETLRISRGDSEHSGIRHVGG